MKKLLLTPLVIILAVSIVLGSCGGTKETTTPATTSPSTTPTTTAEVIELNMSYHAPLPASLTQAIIIPWADNIEVATGGRVDIIQHPGGTLLGVADAYDGVLSRICDIAQLATEEYPGRFPRSGIDNLPYIYPNTEIAGVVAHEIINKYCVDTELQEVKMLITMPLHMQHYLGNEPVETLEDFDGLNIRSPGKVASDLIVAYGATPIALDTSELFSALDTGMVDATFFTFSGSLAFGIKDVTKYATQCGVMTNVFRLVMNKEVFNSLPDDIKKIIDENSTPEVSRKYSADHEATEENYLQAINNAIRRKGDPPIYIVPEDELARWKAAAQPVVDEWVAEMEDDGLPGQAMIDDVISLIEQYSQP